MTYPLGSIYPSNTLFPGDVVVPLAWRCSAARSSTSTELIEESSISPGKDPVPWNGITGVDEDSNTSSAIYYVDGQIFLADLDPGDFTGSLSAFFWPDELSKCLGIPETADGLYVDNQSPKRFSFSYRTMIGSGDVGDMFGYQIHLIYNAMAQIRTRSRKTVNDNAAPMEFQFDLTATPVAMPGFRPSAHYIIDTRHLPAATLANLETILYGNTSMLGSMPDPATLYNIMKFGSAITYIDNLDGTWTATGSISNVHLLDANTYEIKNTTAWTTAMVPTCFRTRLKEA